MKRRRRLLWAGVGVAAAVLALPILYLALLLLNSVNPMQLAFLASFTMYNASGADVWVTPIGMLQGSGKYGPLPRYRDSYPPAWLAGRNCDIPVPQDAPLTLTYDWDDTNFRYILVRDARGNVFLLDTDKMGDLDNCYAPQEDLYTIPPLTEMPQAPADLIPCTQGKSVRYVVIEYE